MAASNRLASSTARRMACISVRASSAQVPLKLIQAESPSSRAKSVSATGPNWARPRSTVGAKGRLFEAATTSPSVTNGCDRVVDRG